MKIKLLLSLLAVVLLAGCPPPRRDFTPSSARSGIDR